MSPRRGALVCALLLRVAFATTLCFRKTSTESLPTVWCEDAAVDPCKVEVLWGPAFLPAVKAQFALTDAQLGGVSVGGTCEETPECGRHNNGCLVAFTGLESVGGVVEECRNGPKFCSYLAAKGFIMAMPTPSPLQDDAFPLWLIVVIAACVVLIFLVSYLCWSRTKAPPLPPAVGVPIDTASGVPSSYAPLQEMATQEMATQEMATQEMATQDAEESLLPDDSTNTTSSTSTPNRQTSSYKGRRRSVDMAAYRPTPAPGGHFHYAPAEQTQSPAGGRVRIGF